MPFDSPRRMPRTLAFLALILVSIAEPTRADWPVNGIAVGPSGHARRAPAIAADAAGVIVGWIDTGPAGITTYVQRMTAGGLLAFGWPDTGVSILAMRENVVLLSDGSGGAYVGADPSISLGGAMLTRVSAIGGTVPRWPLPLPHTVLNGAESVADGWTGCAPSPRASAKGSSLRGDRRSPDDVQLTFETYLPVLAAAPGDSLWAAWLHTMEFDGIELSDHVHLGRFKPNGEPTTGWQRYGMPVDNAEAAPPHQFEPALCADDSGGAFVGWVTHTTMPPRVTIHHINRDNSRHTSFAACSTCAFPQSAIGLASDGAGGAFVAWQQLQSDHSQRTTLRRLRPDGSAPAGWPAEGLTLAHHPTRGGSVRHVMGTPVPGSAILADGAGGVFVAWVDLRDSVANGSDVYVQHVLGNGTVSPGWPSGGLAIARASGDQTRPSIASDGAGGLYVAWQDRRSGGWDVYGQHVSGSGALRFGADGTPLCDASGDQTAPVVDANATGSAYVAWEDARSATPNVFVTSLEDHRVPVLASLHSAEASPGVARLRWRVEAASPVTIERSSGAEAWSTIAVRTPSADGWLEVEDRDVAAGHRYGYRLRFVHEAGEPVTGEAWIEIPTRAAFALSGARPNPGRAPFLVAFELPDAAHATLELIDVAGRRIASHAVGALGAGRHQVRIGAAGMTPGLYAIRLTRDGASLVRRTCVIE